MAKTPKPRFAIAMGSRVKDKVTGFEGIVTTRLQHLHMGNRYDVTPPGTSPDGKLKEVYSFDEAALTVMPDDPIEKVGEPDFKHDLGVRVRDTVSLIEGIVTARAQHIHLCNRYTIQPQGLSDKGGKKDLIGADENAIEVLERRPFVQAVRRENGGPPTSVPRV